MNAPPPLEVYYDPVGAAVELLECRAPEVLMEGPSNTGKSRAVLEKIHTLAELYPGSRHIILRATRSSMSESVLFTYETHVLTPNHLAKRGPRRATRKTYYYPNGSEIFVVGLDRPDRLMSTEFDTAALFEGTEAVEDAWEKITTRLRNQKIPAKPHEREAIRRHWLEKGYPAAEAERASLWWTQAIIDTNPGAPTHWINKRATSGLMVRLLSRHADNPRITAAELERLKNLTGARRARLYEGRWAAAEGAIYDQFDKAVHVREPFGPAVRRVIGIDDGFTNPFVALAGDADNDGRVHIAAEVYRSGMREGEKVEAVWGLYKDAVDRKLSCIAVADPSAAGLISALRDKGITCLEADNSVLDGIAKVQQRMVVAGDGKPRWTVAPSCIHTIEEHELYEWNDKSSKEAPKKVDDHTPDAGRYLVMFLDANPGTRFYSSAPDPAPTRRRDDWLDDDDD